MYYDFVDSIVTWLHVNANTSSDSNISINFFSSIISLCIDDISSNVGMITIIIIIDVFIIFSITIINIIVVDANNLYINDTISFMFERLSNIISIDDNTNTNTNRLSLSSSLLHPSSLLFLLVI